MTDAMALTESKLARHEKLSPFKALYCTRAHVTAPRFNQVPCKNVLGVIVWSNVAFVLKRGTDPQNIPDIGTARHIKFSIIILILCTIFNIYVNKQ